MVPPLVRPALSLRRASARSLAPRPAVPRERLPVQR